MVKWQFSFEVDGIHLSKNKVSVSERVDLERIDDYKSRAHIIIDISQPEGSIVIPSSKPAKEILNDFLSVYLVVTGMSGRIVQELGGSQVPGTGGRGASVSPVRTITVRPTIPESDSMRMIEQAKRDFEILADAENSLKLAVRHSYQAAQTERAEDKVILYFICLDALYIEAPGELGYRLSQRVALMLGESEDERKGIFEKVKGLYRKRGSIVHGVSTSLSPEDVDSLRDYVHRSISMFFELKVLGKSKSDILNLLDSAWQSGKLIDELLQSE